MPIPGQEPQQQPSGYSSVPGSDAMSMRNQFPGQPGQGGTGGTAGGNYASYSSRGYGTMPESASPLSQALTHTPQAPGSYSADPQRAFEGAQRGWVENIGRQGTLQGQQDQMFQQQLQFSSLKNQALSRLLSLFGGGGAGGANPFLAGMQGGPVQADPRILAAEQSKVQEQFDRPGGLRSQTQQLEARQGRFASGSVMGAQRDAALDLAQSRAMTEAYLPAQQATVQGYQPTMQAAGIWGQQNVTPALIAQMLTQSVGR